MVETVERLLDQTIAGIDVAVEEDPCRREHQVGRMVLEHELLQRIEVVAGLLRQRYVLGNCVAVAHIIGAQRETGDPALEVPFAHLAALGGHLQPLAVERELLEREAASAGLAVKRDSRIDDLGLGNLPAAAALLDDQQVALRQHVVRLRGGDVDGDLEGLVVDLPRQLGSDALAVIHAVGIPVLRVLGDPRLNGRQQFHLEFPGQLLVGSLGPDGADRKQQPGDDQRKAEPEHPVPGARVLRIHRNLPLGGLF